VADPTAIEVAVTWSAALGCVFYLISMYRAREHGGRAQLFLVAVMAALLSIRGFGWLAHDNTWLRPTFAFATLLPLAITLFIERVLRRHHPLWVKLLSFGVSTGFFAANMLTDLTTRRGVVAAFGACLALVVLVNAGLLMARRDAELSEAETRLADLLLVVTLISVPLVLTDFRTQLGFGSIRLGGLAALLFIYAMVGSPVRSMSASMWLIRVATLAVLALLLSALMALALEGFQLEACRAAVLRAMPVASAWLLLTGIVVNRMAIASAGNTQAFLRWLARAPLTSGPHFLRSLGDSPDASSFLVLESSDLVDYRAAALARLLHDNDGVVSLSIARHRRNSEDPVVADSAEQWTDLFERTQTTHGFVSRHEPPTVVLVSLPSSTSAAAAEERLRVVQHLARHLEAP
jgi:hypothetical protein